MQKKYSYNDYDKYLSLKPDAALWSVIIYLLHPYLLLLSAARSKQPDAAGLKNIVYSSDFSLAVAILSTIPVLCLIYAWVKRSPDGGKRVRYIWHHGALFISVTALLNATAAFVPYLMGVEHGMPALGWTQISISVLIVLYVYFSRRARDVFADFPG